MVITEIRSKSILSPSKIYDYVINPYGGCSHACTYCYARFMKRFTGHREPWGDYVDVKMNAPELLRKEITRKKRGTVWMSGVCDPYQPLEQKYGLTRKCLEILAVHEWPVVIQTRSSLVLRDLDILKGMKECEVGFSVTTADDDIRKLFEPRAPAIPERLHALEELHRAGVRTYAMIAPMLPGAELLSHELEGRVDYVLVDRMNYSHADGLYRKFGLDEMRSDDYFARTGRTLAREFRKLKIPCNVVF